MAETLTTWTKLPPIEEDGGGCLNCPVGLARAPLDKLIAVGFGDAHASRDGEEVYREPSAYHGRLHCTACAFWGYADQAGTVLCGTCGGEGWIDDPDASEACYWDFEEVEKLAAADPDHDWRVVLHGPMHGETYQRHGDGEWNLVEKNEGFA